MKKINYIVLAVLAIITFSCEQTYDKEYSANYPLIGDWSVMVFDGAHKTGPYEIKSYNTSSSKDSIWFDDYGTGVAAASEYGNFWTMKYKVAIDLATKTFNTANSINAIPDYDIAIKVSEGKIVGNDSIYFKIEFGDDPGTVYEISGHRANKFDDYMHN